MELAVLIEAGEPFVKATYNLDGDNPLFFFDVYKETTILESFIAVDYFPSVHAIVRQMAGGVPSRETLMLQVV